MALPTLNVPVAVVPDADDLDLTIEARDKVLSIFDIIGDDLDRHVAARQMITRPVDARAAAMTDFFEQLKLFEAEADIVFRRDTICLPHGSPERGCGGGVSAKGKSQRQVYSTARLLARA